MRTIKFEKDELSQKRFEVLFHGLIVTGNTNTQKGLVVLSRELSLLDKFEAISRPCECGKKLPGLDEPDRELDFSENIVDNTIEMDDQEAELLCDYVGRVPWSIGAPSRLALQTITWLKNGSVGNGSKTS